MQKTKNPDDIRRQNRTDAVLLCLAFATSGIIGYLLTNHVALLGF
jgi:hypothetical protein